MEPKFNSSFIPKQMLQEDVTGGPSSSNKYVKRRDIMGPGYFVSVIVFAIALIVSIGLFTYTKVIDKRISDKLVNLESTQQGYDTRVINDLARVEKRFTEAQRLLNGHLATTELFDLLEEITLTRVRYTRLQYEYATGGSRPIVALAGEASSYEDVALQMEVFRTNEHLINPAVVRLGTQQDRVTGRDTTVFELKSMIDPRLITYAAALSEGRRVSGSVQQPLSVPTVPSTDPVPDAPDATDE